MTFERCAFFISDIEIFTSYNLRKLFFIEKSINAAIFSDLIKVDNYEVSDKGGDLSPGLLCWGQQKRLDTVSDCQLTFQIREALRHYMGHGQQVTCIQELANVEVIDLQRQGGKFVKISGHIFCILDQRLTIQFNYVNILVQKVKNSKYFVLGNYPWQLQLRGS